MKNPRHSDGWALESHWAPSLRLCFSQLFLTRTADSFILREPELSQNDETRIADFLLGSQVLRVG